MRRVKWRLLVYAGASVLAACASNAPVNSTGAPSASATTIAPAVSVADKSGSSTVPETTKTKVPHGYQRAVRNGTEYYCRYEPVVGSRTARDEICLTKDQMSEGQQSVEEFRRQLENMPVNPQSVNPSPRGR